MIHFRFVIVRIDVQADLEFLQLGGVLVFSRLAIAFFLFVLVFAEIDHPAHRRCGVGRHFYKVHSLLLGRRQCLADRDDPELFPVSVYDPHFAGANLLIDTNKLLNCDDLLLPFGGQLC